MTVLGLFPSVSNKAITIARFLREFHPTVEVVGFDDSNLPPFFSRRHFNNVMKISKPKEKTTPNNCFFCQNYSAIKHILFLPLNSHDIRMLMAHNCKILGNSKHLIDLDNFQLLDNKIFFSNLCQELGLQHTAFATASDKYVVKPIIGSGSNGVRYFKDKALAQEYIAMMCRGDLVIEPFVAGDSYGFEGYVRNGVFRHFTGHRRLLEFPLKGGSSVLRELASKDSINQMHQICSSVVQKLRVTGFIMFEFKRTPQGVFILLECNPRIWGSINQALLSEPNLFNDLFGSIQYRKREANNIHTDNWPLSWFIFLLSLFKRTFKQNLILFSVLLRSKHDVSFKLDRFNFFGYLWKMLN